MRKQPACSDGDAAEAQLELLRTAVLAEGGLLPTAIAIAAERGRAELDPADLIDAASKVAAEHVTGGRLASGWHELASEAVGCISQRRAIEPSLRTRGLHQRSAPEGNRGASLRRAWRAHLAGLQAVRQPEARHCCPWLWHATAASDCGTPLLPLAVARHCCL